MKDIKVFMADDGPRFSRIVAGVMTWGVWGENFKIKEAANYIDQCLDIGITTFDHADIYGHYTTEALFGKATKGKSTTRQKMQLITKCGIRLVTPNRPSYKIASYDTSKSHILASVERSLANLKTDYIDLLLIHRPSPLMYPEEIAEAFNALKQAGKVINFGVSNFTSSQFAMLNDYIPLMTNQVEISLLHLDFLYDGTLDQCIQHGISPMAYSTMAKGRFFAANPEKSVVAIRKLAKQLTKKYKTTYEQLLTAFLLKHPAGILPIMGSTKIARLKAAVAALSIDLSREDWFSLLEAAKGEPVP